MRLVGKSRRGAQRRGRNKRRWLLLGGQQEGNGDILKFHPWNTSSFHVSAVSPHHTDTHADRRGMRSKRREADRRSALTFIHTVTAQEFAFFFWGFSGL